MKPYFFMIGYGFTQTLVWLIVSYLSESIAIVVMFLFRNLIGFAISFFKTPVSQLQKLQTNRLGIHIIRAAATLIGGISIFYSVSVLPIADAVAITFLAPIFAGLLSMFFLNEKVNLVVIAKLVFGFVGVCIITGFDATGEVKGYLSALLGALMTGVAYVSVKSLSETETPDKILLTSYLIMIPVSVFIALFAWTTPTYEEVFWLIMIGVFFYLSQLLMANAFLLAPVSKLLPVDYLRVIFSSIMGYFILEQTISEDALIGSLVILCASLLPSSKTKL